MNDVVFGLLLFVGFVAVLLVVRRLLVIPPAPVAPAEPAPPIPATIVAVAGEDLTAGAPVVIEAGVATEVKAPARRPRKPAAKSAPKPKATKPKPKPKKTAAPKERRRRGKDARDG